MAASRVTSAAVAEGFESLLYDVADHVATVTINRPERRNALSWTVMTELRAALAAGQGRPGGAGRGASPAPATRRSAPGPTCRAWPPVPASPSSTTPAARWPACSATLWELGKPTIARVRGYALAGGFGLALMCDVVDRRRRRRSSARPRSTSGCGR